MRLLIGIPIYNEWRYVGRVLDEVLSYGHDVLLVDDASTDGTGEYLAGRDDIALIRHDANKGYGQGIIDIFDYADRCGYDWVVTMDCDEQHEPPRIRDFVRAIEAADDGETAADIISGSRYLRHDDADTAAPADRAAINHKITALVNDAFGWTLTDTFCGFKAHRVSALRQLQLTEAGYAFPLQLWPRVYKAGLRVREIPVARIYNDMNRSFGPVLNDAGRRLRHYLDVFEAELALPWPPPDAGDAVGGGSADRQGYCCY